MVQRKSNKLPKLIKHAILRVTDTQCKRKYFYLGHWPENQPDPLIGAQIKWLEILQSISQGEDTAKSAPIEPINPEQFELILNNLGSQVLKDMAGLQWLTGCRPGEIIRMTWAQINQTGAVWRFQPAEHKTAHLGHQRTIAIGPQGQEILGWYLSKKFQPDLPIFSHKDATLEFNPAKRATVGWSICSLRESYRSDKGTAKAHRKPQKTHA